MAERASAGGDGAQGGAAPSTSSARSAPTASGGFLAGSEFGVNDAAAGEARLSWEATELRPAVARGAIVSKLGYEFRWTADHKVGAELEPLRQLGDALADDALGAMLDAGELRHGDDPVALLRRRAAAGAPEACALLRQLCDVPAWVDWAALRRGQLVFLRHGPGAGIALMYLSLVGGFSAPKINKVLTSTGYLSGTGAGGEEATWRRLWETTQMILSCMEPGAMRPPPPPTGARSAAGKDDEGKIEGGGGDEGGEGWLATVRVRFLHARVRRRLLASSRWLRRGKGGEGGEGSGEGGEGGGEGGGAPCPAAVAAAAAAAATAAAAAAAVASSSDTGGASEAGLVCPHTGLSLADIDASAAGWGVPINQEDLSATLLSFQINVIFALERMGCRLTQQERDDYTLLWRYIGHVMGILPEHNACRSFRYSKAFLESLVMHLLEPDGTSQRLSQHVLRTVSHRPPGFMPFGANCELARMLMGDPLADALQLPRSHALHRAGHHVFFAMLRLFAWLAKLPVLGGAMLWLNGRSLRAFLRAGLGGKPARFTMSHAPADGQRDRVVLGGSGGREDGGVGTVLRRHAPLVAAAVALRYAGYGRRAGVGRVLVVGVQLLAAAQLAGAVAVGVADRMAGGRSAVKDGSGCGPGAIGSST
jgi:hypothetical protein